MSAKKIGKKLDAIRLKMGITQFELVDKCRVPISTLQRILWGKSAKLQNVCDVADALGHEIVVVEKSIETKEGIQ